MTICRCILPRYQVLDEADVSDRSIFLVIDRYCSPIVQHLLSGAVMQLFKCETVSWELGTEDVVGTSLFATGFALQSLSNFIPTLALVDFAQLKADAGDKEEALLIGNAGVEDEPEGKMPSKSKKGKGAKQENFPIFSAKQVNEIESLCNQFIREARAVQLRIFDKNRMQLLAASTDSCLSAGSGRSSTTEQSMYDRS